MSHRSQIWIKGLGIFSACVMIGSTCFSTSTIAHVINEEVLTIPLKQPKHVENIQCSLLTEAGQTILIQKEFSELKIPITVSSAAVLNETEERVKVTVMVESSDEERLQASLDAGEFELKEETKTVNLTLRLVEPEEEIAEETPEEVPEETVDLKQETSELETVISEPEASESDVQIQQPLMVGTSGEVRPEEGTKPEETPEKTPEDPGPETPEVPDGTPSGGEEMPPTGENTLPETEKNPEGETPKGEDSDKEETEEEDQEKEDEEAVTEPEESRLEVRVELKSGERTYHAVFAVAEELDFEDCLGELSYCPKQYHPEGIIELINNQDIETVLGEFPAMTGYELAGEKYMLYDGGKIFLSAGEKIKLDISNTGLKQDLVFVSDGGTEYQIAYEEAPDTLYNAGMLIMQTEEVTLPVNYQWGEITPVVVIEQLTMEENGLTWNPVETITHHHDDGGKIKLIPNNPEAGTYRVIISWMEGDITLYKMEKPFYVQHKSADYGGNGQ